MTGVVACPFWAFLNITCLILFIVFFTLQLLSIVKSVFNLFDSPRNTAAVFLASFT